MRIAINGFGRIGRTILRQVLSLPDGNDIEIALINDIASAEMLGYLFQYDSTFGPLPHAVETFDDQLVVAGSLHSAGTRKRSFAARFIRR